MDLALWWQIVPTAALVSAGTTLFIRWRDRPRPVLVTEMLLLSGNTGRTSTPGHPVWVAVTNTGDGPAHDFRVYGDRCDATIALGESRFGREAHSYRVPVISPGERVTVQTYIPSGMEDEARVVLTWTTHPGRIVFPGRRVRHVTLQDVELEEVLPPGLHDPGRIPRWARRRKVLETRSPRARHRLQWQQGVIRNQPPSEQPQPPQQP